MSSATRPTTARASSKKTTSPRPRKVAPEIVTEPAPEPSATSTASITPELVAAPFLGDMICAFDPAWYAREYQDVAAAGIDPATHYRETGYREGRQPNRFFSTADYRAANPDLQEYEGDLFLHFIFYGIHEGRRLR